MAVRSPLYDIYDPYGVLRQQAEMGFLPQDDEELEPIGVAPLGNRQVGLSDLMPQEEQRSMLQGLAAVGSSGLAGLGWILDTPGAMVRGTLSGGLGKGLSALWETSDDRVDGRELLRQYGMAGDDDNWWNFSGGLAAEALLDPLTYGTLGLNQLLGRPAKTLAGKAAQKAGLMDNFDLFARNSMDMGRREAMRKATPEKLLGRLSGPAQDEARKKFMSQFADEQAARDALTAPLARMNRVGLPGMEGAYDLFTEQVGDWTARLGDQMGKGLMTSPYTGPALRRATALFGDADVLGMTDYDRQWEAKELSALRRQSDKALREQLARHQFDTEKALKEAGYTAGMPDFYDAMRTAIETGDDNVPDEMRALLDLPAPSALRGFFEGKRAEAIAAAERLGMPLNEYMSRAGVDWFPRQQTAFDVPQRPKWPEGVAPPESIKQQYTRGPRRANVSDNLGRSRQDYLDIMGGTDIINRMSVDPDLQARLRAATNDEAKQILDEWWGASGAKAPQSATAPQSFWDDGILMREAGFDDAPPGMSYVGDGTVMATKAQGPSDSIYGWMDATDEAGDYLHPAPALPATHPLMAEQAALKDQIDKATRAGELHRVAPLQKQLKAVAAQIPKAERQEWQGRLYGQLADFMRAMDPQHAKTGVPIFGQNSFNEMARYILGRGRTETDAQFLLDTLKKNRTDVSADQVLGGVNYTAEQALEKLGLTGDNAMDVLANAIGSPLDQVSFNKKLVDDWASRAAVGRLPENLSPLMEGVDDLTKSFKTLALAWPSRYTRDLYSGGFAAAMRNSYNPIDRYVGTQVRRGNYDPLVKPMLGGLIPPRLAGIPEYDELLKTNPDEAIRKFLSEAGGQGLGGGSISDEMLTGASNAQMREMYPGAARPEWRSLLRKFWNPDRTAREAIRDYWPFAVRGGDGNRNPFLELADRAAETTDAANRFGTYLTQLRGGAAPSEAMRIADLTQVRYSPDAFTPFERDVMKRVMPFYSYTRGILPLITNDILEQPAGLMGQSVRAITRGSAPSEQNFTPEYLRQSASIPLPQGMSLIGLPEDSSLRRYLTNIDLPFESAINLITPGTGNSILDKMGSGIRKTALNVLGQTNPLIKAPLELATNRQFYSGRQLSDLYSMLEQPLGSPGRVLEQLAVNAPGGSRVLGTVRQLMDDRLSGQEKAAKLLVNTLSGLKFQDVDMERTKRLAARDMLNQLLEATPGVRTYENITVPEDVLRAMAPEQQKQYLLYKIIQAEAAKRARDKKRAESALDPLQVLGALR
jgi:hypothetical protein